VHDSPGCVLDNLQVSRARDVCWGTQRRQQWNRDGSTRQFTVDGTNVSWRDNRSSEALCGMIPPATMRAGMLCTPTWTLRSSFKSISWIRGVEQRFVEQTFETVASYSGRAMCYVTSESRWKNSSGQQRWNRTLATGNASVWYVSAYKKGSSAASIHRLGVSWATGPKSWSIPSFDRRASTERSKLASIVRACRGYLTHNRLDISRLQRNPRGEDFRGGSARANHHVVLDAHA